MSAPINSATNPAPHTPLARTPGAYTPSPDAPGAARAVTRVGLALAVSAPLWAVVMTVIADHEGFGWQSLVGGVTALAFQLSILGLLWVQDSNGAMTRPGGAGKVARIGYRIEAAVVCGAIVSTIFDSFWLIQGTVVWHVFDLCWPLSMLGMLIIGIRVAIAGRWKSPLRWQVLFAQAWLLFGIPLSVLGQIGFIAVTVQVFLGYGLLGVLLARRPQAALTRG
ncbi:MAG: hypothetical protein QM658_07645 [Gordonia sp. (in: high G+C Gram-positive bacteria)]